jgi:uncharacterized membrane protein YedE/YeeE
MKGVIALIVGFLFALGLGFSGMTQPHIVRGFLDIFGAWDWRLLGVMAGAIGVHAISYYFIMKKKTPLLDEKFHVPSLKHFDAKLFVGAMLFGLGWGWTGICPGPGIVSLASGQKEFFYFIISMLV